MRTADFDFPLPPTLIAQAPTGQRDQSRLLVIDRTSGELSHRQFRDLPEFLKSGDVLVMNDTKVIPARLRGLKTASGGQIEILLLEENQVNDWWVLLRPGKRVRAGTKIRFIDKAGNPCDLHGEVLDKNAEGHCRLRFSGVENVRSTLSELGEVPLPPYINRRSDTEGVDDQHRYQTVYASDPGSVAAPTAGLHFTEALLEKIRSLGVKIGFVTLHVGLGTFAPVKAESLDQHVMHEERYEIDDETANLINTAKHEGRRVIAIGTTTVRVLETVAEQFSGEIRAVSGRTRIFIYPPREFRMVDALLTNFHLPQSTLLMLVSAFAAPGETRGIELIRRAYQEAILYKYRFFSYGDAMFLH